MKILVAFGVTTLIANTIIMLHTWFLAFFNDYKVEVHINDCNEAWIELIWLPLTLIIGIWSVIYLWKKSSLRL